MSAIALNRTLDAHLSKAFDDEGEDLGKDEFHDDAEHVAPEHRIRVTAKGVCDMAGTGLHKISTPAMATMLFR